MAEWAPAPECFSELWLQFGKGIISSGCVGRGRSALAVKCLSLWSSLYFCVLPFPFVCNRVPCRRLSDSSTWGCKSAVGLGSVVRMLVRPDATTLLLPPVISAVAAWCFAQVTRFTKATARGSQYFPFITAALWCNPGSCTPSAAPFYQSLMHQILRTSVESCMGAWTSGVRNQTEGDISDSEPCSCDSVAYFKVKWWSALV